MGSPATPPPTYSELDVALPIVMLPVRIETRYFAVDAANIELRVRIFPSAAHITTDRPTVDQVEHDQLVSYWTIRAAQGDGSDAAAAAWRQVTDLFGSARAQWLRRTLKPVVNADHSLTFPAVPITPAADGSASMPSQATGLPTRFFVTGYAGTARQFVTTGLKIPVSINVGAHSDPQAVAWQSDFGAAEAIGLAVRIPMQKPAAAQLTRLFVFGVREGADAATSRAALEDLLQRHIRGDGAALLQPGTPTNNTSASRTPDPPPPPDVTPSAASDGYRLANAFGVDPAIFAGVGGSNAASDLLVRSMHQAMWPATLGYFMQQVMSPVFGSLGVTRGESLYVVSVRPGGPYSTLLLGDQPYGVLPVTAGAAWKTAAGTTDQVMQGLQAMIPQWKAAAAKAPRLGASGDAGTDLTAILSQSADSRRWIGRKAESYLIAGRKFTTGDASLYQAKVQAARNHRAQTELAPLGLTGTPLALDFMFDATVFDLNAPLVAPAPADETAPLASNYIAAIGSATADALKNNTVAGASPRTLLYLFLRHSTLMVLSQIADQVLKLTPLRDATFVESTTDTVWTRLATPSPALGNVSAGNLLQSTAPVTVNLNALDLHRESLKNLAAASVGDLERLTAQAMDAVSHRLDAWITACATDRLVSMRRQGHPLGAHLGAYAWVDAPAIPDTLSADTAAPAADPNSEGFLHAPSLNQARTAAVLRAAFLAREGEGSQASLAVDLSSDRVRLAQRLFADVQGGASVAAALAARVERTMIELNLGPQLAAVRTEFPLDSGDGRARIDGVALAQAWNAKPPGGALQPVADMLKELVDAAGDLLLAEAVHQQTTGNPQRAQVSLAALETGAALPPDFEILRTEPDSSTVSWRLVLPFSGDALHAWMGQTIGDPAQLFATVTPAAGGPASQVSLASLGLTALDLQDFVHDGPEAPALAARFATAGAGAAAYTPQLQTALVAAYAVFLLLRGAQPLAAADLGDTTPAVLAGFDLASQRKKWLHDLARLREPVEALDILDSLQRARGGGLDLRFFSAGPNLNLISIGALPVQPDAGTLIDGWNETTPGTDAVTGVALHYDAPRSRPPQAILVVVPSNPKGGWDVPSVENALLDTVELAQMRMVRPHDVQGSFIPALYFADNLQVDTIAANFIEVAYVKELKQ